MKLIRDNIPNIIRSAGKKPIYQIALEQEYKEFLKKKLQEEVDEFLLDESVEEIADVLEVLEFLAKANGYDWQEVLAAQREKRKTNGGFDQRLILEKVE